MYKETLDLKDSRGKQISKRDKRGSLSLVRYADDFVVLHRNYSTILRCKEIISSWLSDIGLELKPSKTRITHTLHNVGKEKAGFDFLGTNIKQYKVGKYTSGRHNKNTLGFKTLIKPSKKSIAKHYEQIAKIIDTSISFKQERLIGRLNPVIKGWCNYFSAFNSSDAFNYLDSITFWKLWKWGVKRHETKGRKWLKAKYFQTESFSHKKENKSVDKNWIFATTIDGNIDKRLISHAETKISKFVKIKGNSSPYDGNTVYWSTRLGRNPLMPQRKAKLLKTQKGKCNWCKLTFRHEDVIEVDHIIPTSNGGTDYYKNLQLLHRHCHDEKTLTDGFLKLTFKPAKLPQGWYWKEGMLVT